MIKFVQRVVFLAIVFLLSAACGSKEEEQAQLEGGNTASTTVTPEDSPFAVQDLPANVIRLPASDEISGGLLLAVNEGNTRDSLYYARFDGQPAHLLSEQVISFRISLSPYAPLVAYPARDNRYWHFVLTDLRTMETIEIVRINLTGDIHSWSPDGQWLSFHTTEQGLMVYNIPSGTITEVSGQSRTSAWLNDNTLVYVTTNEAETEHQLKRYFPQENRHETLIENITVSPPEDLIALETVLNEQDSHFAAGFDQFERRALAPDGQARYVVDWADEVWNGDYILCKSWQITEQEPQSGTDSVVYDVGDTHFLSHLSTLPDGGLMFLKWNIEDCTFGNSMQVSLLQLDSEGTVTMITDDIYAGSNRAVRSHRYATVDGFVFWIGQRPARETIINATELDTGIVTTLLSMQGSRIFNNIFYVGE